GLSYLKALTLANRSDDARRVHEDGLRRGIAWPALAAMQARKPAAVAEPPEGWRAHANKLLAGGLLLEALDGFTRAIAQRADDLEARLARARTFVSLHRHEEAERAFRELLAALPQWPAAQCGHAATLVALGRVPE